MSLVPQCVIACRIWFVQLIELASLTHMVYGVWTPKIPKTNREIRLMTIKWQYDKSKPTFVSSQSC